jgi:hypothetical protein
LPPAANAIGAEMMGWRMPSASVRRVESSTLVAPLLVVVASRVAQPMAAFGSLDY